MKSGNYQQKIKIACILSCSSTFASIILAILPGVISLIKYKSTTSYNPNIAILTASLIGLIWYVYWTYRLAINPKIEKLETKEEYKASLATALMVELQWINKNLRDIYNGEVWAFDPISYPLLIQAEHNINIFSTTTITKIVAFHNRILLFQNSFKDEIDGFVLEYYKEEGRIESHKRFNKMKAFLAIEALNELVNSLQNEGGEIPPTLIGISFNLNDELPILPNDLFKNQQFRER